MFKALTNIISHYKDLEQYNEITRCMGAMVPKVSSAFFRLLPWENDVKKICLIFSDWFKAYDFRLAIAHYTTRFDCQS